MTEQVLSEMKKIDTQLFEIGKHLRPAYYLTPINLNTEKETFFSSSTYEPVFAYRQLDHDAKKTEDLLQQIEIPSNDFSEMYEKRKKNLLLENRILRYKNDSEKVREYAAELYGKLEVDLVHFAKEHVAQYVSSEIETEKTVPAVEMTDIFQETLNSYGLSDWHIELNEKLQTSVVASQKKITICKDRFFSKETVARLRIHELLVHVLRAANGYTQPLRIFAIGLPMYTATEEGFAAYAEELTQTTDTVVMKNYCGRVLGVQSVYDRMSFRETFEYLRSFDFSKEEAWILCARIYRGGGYLKDHIYLEGYRKVKAFHLAGGNLNALYVGKIGLDDIPFVNTLLQKELINKPKYLPDFV